MELATTLPADTPLRAVADTVRRVERLGFDTVHVPETVHDSLSVALLALEHSSRLTVRTSMTVAFPRSPMVLAYAAWDLTRFSGGRFQLGVATQVRGNLVGRFSVPWSEPAPWLADYLRALRAIFASFGSGEPLSYTGSHYRFHRLQPYFNPGPIDVPPPPVWAGGVNRAVCRTAGELADGYVAHLTNCHPRFLRERCLPALAEGAAARTDGGPRVVVVPRCVTGPDSAALAEDVVAVRRELAFLYSTRAYRPTLALLGHADVGAALTDLVRAERWTELPSVLTDDALADLVPHAAYADLPAVLRDWYGGRCDGIALRLPDDPDHDGEFGAMLPQLRDIPTRTPR